MKTVVLIIIILDWCVRHSSCAGEREDDQEKQEWNRNGTDEAFFIHDLNK